MKQLQGFVRRAAALVLAAVLCLCAPAALAADDAAVSGGAVTMGGANTTLIPAEEENCLSWLFGSGDTITLPYLNIRGQGLKKNVTLNLVDCLVGITYNELGSIGSYVSASAAQQAWKAQAVAAHSYLEYHKQYGSSANALVYTPVDQIPSAAREAIRKAVEPVKDEILTYNGSVCDAVWSASAGYNTQTGVYGTCSSRDAWGTEVPYLQSVESPYEEQYHNLLRRSIGKDYTYVEYNDSRTGEPYTDADTTHKSLGGYVQYNTFVSNGRSYRYIGQFVSSRYCFDFGTDENGTPCMTYYGFGHGVGMSQCGAVGYAAERNMGYKAILRHYYKGASITSQGSSGGLFGWLRSLFGLQNAPRGHGTRPERPSGVTLAAKKEPPKFWQGLLKCGAIWYTIAGTKGFCDIKQRICVIHVGGLSASDVWKIKVFAKEWRRKHGVGSGKIDPE